MINSLRASLSKIWLYAGRSEYPTLRELLRQLSKSRDNAMGADNQQERPVRQISRERRQEIWRAKREVCGRARLQSCRKGGKIDGASAPEV
jgi:hypothetical protein